MNVICDWLEIGSCTEEEIREKYCSYSSNFDDYNDVSMSLDKAQNILNRTQLNINLQNS